MKNPMFAFAACLRHAFMSGAGVKDHEPVTHEQIMAWTEYDPPNVGAFKTMANVLAVAGREDAKVFVPAPSTTGVSIVAAAIRVGKVILSVQRPGRHNDIINDEFVRTAYSYDEGFLTSAGFFVDRETALELAIKSGQFKFGPDHRPTGTKRELFSEDLW
ncbi:hypothetical protein F406_gp023 [Agrobacterium phage 7-7-1]|uniref:Uncharacterized protein n=1 Tax=Agrobacterium phage 7-7-1 TaxID=1161931 RepID=J7F9F7_9CAUD|nr:hypothetical protein F406_gp023 [Agrobacterium phage 7-7-1]AFH19792.1 hypothetical protein 7-7-1_00094 [Agrobacterium phage 7-7-1]